MSSREDYAEGMGQRSSNAESAAAICAIVSFVLFSMTESLSCFLEIETKPYDVHARPRDRDIWLRIHSFRRVTFYRARHHSNGHPFAAPLLPLHSQDPWLRDSGAGTYFGAHSRSDGNAIKAIILNISYQQFRPSSITPWLCIYMYVSPI